MKLPLRFRHCPLGLYAVVVLASASLAQDAGKDGPVSPEKRLASPKATMKTFLTAKFRVEKEEHEESGWLLAITCLDLSEVDPRKARVFVQKLWGIIDRLEYIG